MAPAHRPRILRPQAIEHARCTTRPRVSRVGPATGAHYLTAPPPFPPFGQTVTRYPAPASACIVWIRSRRERPPECQRMLTISAAGSPGARSCSDRLPRNGPDPDSPDPTPNEGRDLYVRGLLELRDGDAEVAVDLLQAALRQRPAHQGMRRNLLRALIKAGWFQEALAQADAALAGTPNEAEFHFVRGTSLHALNKPAEAGASLTRAVALRPGHAPSLLNLANAWVDLDDLEVAEDLCRRAIRLNPGADRSACEPGLHPHCAGPAFGGHHGV